MTPEQIPWPNGQGRDVILTPSLTLEIAQGRNLLVKVVRTGQPEGGIRSFPRGTGIGEIIVALGLEVPA